MTDMRATERLLQVIEELATMIASAANDSRLTSARYITEAVQELRRRGDTLVHGHDLRTLVERYDAILVSDNLSKDDSDELRRLENAIGGRMR